MNSLKRNYAMSNRRRSFLFFLCLIFILTLIFLDKSLFENKRQSWFSNSTQRENSDFEKYHSKKFTVTNVIDGDTLDIDCPDIKNRYTRIRLLGIDTPEINSESGEMYFAMEALEFARNTAFGKEVTIYLDEKNNTRDKYNRLLTYVMLPGGEFLNEIILSEGFAYSYTKYRHSYYNKYNQLESRARSRKKGLWLNVTPDQFPQWLQDINKETK
jgi:micrococcal nuclease